MKAKPININDIKEWLEYKDGHLYWKKKRKNGAGMNVGKMFGGPDKAGYRCGMLLGKEYKEHRLIYALHHGSCPDMIDHRNRITDDNHIENLRPADPQLNVLNRGINKNNTSGYKGVTWSKPNGLWEAYYKPDYKRTVIGYSKCKICAALLYNYAARLEWGAEAFSNKGLDCTCQDCNHFRRNHWEYIFLANNSRSTNNMRGVEKTKSGKFSARINKNKKNHRLGIFACVNAAQRAFNVEHEELGRNMFKANYYINYLCECKECKCL